MKTDLEAKHLKRTITALKTHVLDSFYTPETSILVTAEQTS